VTGYQSSPWSAHKLTDPAEVVREEIRRARRALKIPGDVHEARRALKRARALLRLSQAGPRLDTARRIRRELRDAGRRLSGTRDAEVAAEVAREMETEFGSPPSLADELEARRQGAQDALDAGLGTEVRFELGAVGKEARALLGAVEVADAVRGVGRAYRRARSAYRHARSHPRITRMHILRKRVKDLRYQLEWLAPVWPEVLEGWTGELHALTDDLGRIQDIHVLRTTGHVVSDPGDRRRLAWALQGLRRELRRTRRRAFRTSARLFAEEPDAFQARMVTLAEL
jgi:CHAD domain-containing protein